MDALARWSHLAAVAHGCSHREVHVAHEHLRADQRFHLRILRSRRILPLDEPSVRAVLDGGVAVGVRPLLKRRNRHTRHLGQGLGNPLHV